MDKSEENKSIAPLFIFFMLVTAFCVVAKTWLAAKNIDPRVLGFGNIILFILSLFIYRLQKKAMGNKNPNVFVRAVMLGTFIKLMVIAVSVMVYIIMAGEKRSVYAIIASMGLYVVYTIIEVRIATKLNRKNGSS